MQTLTDRLSADGHQLTQIEQTQRNLVRFRQGETVLARQRADRFGDDLAADDGAGFENRRRSLGLTDIGPLGIDGDVRVSEGPCGHTVRRVEFLPLRTGRDTWSIQTEHPGVVPHGLRDGWL